MGIKNKTLVDKIRRNDNYFEDFITRSVYHSNAIEGSTLSYYETYQLIFNCSSDEILPSVKPRELYEAINLKYAMDYVYRHLYDDLTNQFIIKIASIINRNINDMDSFRTVPVFIRGAEHIPPDAADVPRLVSELLFSSFKSDNFIYDLASFHIQYERIHPFVDGNGRSGRVLLNKLTLCNGYVPFVIPKDERSAYMECLSNCDVNRLSEMFNHFMMDEINRMKQFGINFEKASNAISSISAFKIE